MKTYHLEYYYDFNPEQVGTCYFTTDRVIKGFGGMTPRKIHENSII